MSFAHSCQAISFDRKKKKRFNLPFLASRCVSSVDFRSWLTEKLFRNRPKRGTILEQVFFFFSRYYRKLLIIMMLYLGGEKDSLLGNYNNSNIGDMARLFVIFLWKKKTSQMRPTCIFGLFIDWHGTVVFCLVFSLSIMDRERKKESSKANSPNSLIFHCDKKHFCQQPFISKLIWTNSKKLTSFNDFKQTKKIKQPLILTGRWDHKSRSRRGSRTLWCLDLMK